MPANGEPRPCRDKDADDTIAETPKKSTVGGALACWGPEEDWYILNGVRNFGIGKWKMLADALPGRSSAAVRNRWYRLDKADKLRRQAESEGRMQTGNRCRICGQLRKGHICSGMPQAAPSTPPSDDAKSEKGGKSTGGETAGTAHVERQELEAQLAEREKVMAVLATQLHQSLTQLEPEPGAPKLTQEKVDATRMLIDQAAAVLRQLDAEVRSLRHRLGELDAAPPYDAAAAALVAAALAATAPAPLDAAPPPYQPPPAFQLPELLLAAEGGGDDDEEGIMARLCEDLDVMDVAALNDAVSIFSESADKRQRQASGPRQSSLDKRQRQTSSPRQIRLSELERLALETEGHAPSTDDISFESHLPVLMCDDI